MFRCGKIVIIVMLAAASIAAALFVGPSELTSEIFWSLRLPRAVTVACVGAGLAVSGVLIQASFGNPLADPFTVGIASAAALGAVIGSALFKGDFFGIGPGAVAFLFAFGFSFIMAAWIRRGLRSSADILLVGVVSGFFFTALATLILSVTEPHALAHSLSWLMGSATYVDLTWSVISAIFVFLITLFAWSRWRHVDLLAVHGATAMSMGVDVQKLKLQLFTCVAIIVSISVGLAGVIGFVGLVVPHALRRVGFRSSAVLIPASFLAGGTLVVIADVFARAVVAPTELPVGVVLSLIGAPTFLWLARRTF